MSKNKEKGDLLEGIVSGICSGIKDAKVQHNVKVTGRSGVQRQIDTLIIGTVGVFDVKILVDPKNYATPVDIKDVESIAGMVSDVDANLGVIVCPNGFTEGAKKRAENASVNLYEIYDQILGNSSLFIPLRYVEAKIDKYNFVFASTSTAGHFSIPIDSERWILHINGKVLRKKNVPIYLWNEGKIPQKAGHYQINVGAIKITDTEEKNSVQYCDLTIQVDVVEDYFLKLFPASFVRQADTTGREHFDLKIDFYSKHEDMIKNGWKRFNSLDEMNKAADIKNQPPGIRGLVMRNNYEIIPADDTNNTNIY